MYLAVCFLIFLFFLIPIYIVDLNLYDLVFSILIKNIYILQGHFSQLAATNSQSLDDL